MKVRSITLIFEMWNMKILMMTDELPEDILNFNIDLIINARYLSERGHGVYLLSHCGGRISDDKFRHIPLGTGRGSAKDSMGSFLVRNSTFFPGALKVMDKIKPDLILCIGAGQLLTTFITGILFSKLQGVPVVSEWRGSDLLLKNSAVRKALKKMILSNSDLNIIRSENMRKMAVDLEPDVELVILPSKGIDMDRFRPKSTSHSSTDGEVKVLYAGRLHELKGLNYLIRAFSRVRKKYPGAELLIVGGGALKDELEEWAVKEGVDEDVKFTGEVEHSELIKYYQSSDIFVLPSLSEGLSNVIMEAMACGLPVIATDVGGNPELVKHERGGLIVNAKDIPSLQRSLGRLLDDPELRGKMGKFNRKYIQKFNQDSVLSKKAELLEKVVESK
ncbi:MAG: glycosyltransferase [Thermoplasmata archaeon]